MAAMATAALLMLAATSGSDFSGVARLPRPRAAQGGIQSRTLSEVKEEQKEKKKKIKTKKNKIAFTFSDPNSYKGPQVEGWPPGKERSLLLAMGSLRTTLVLTFFLNGPQIPSGLRKTRRGQFLAPALFQPEPLSKDTLRGPFSTKELRRQVKERALLKDYAFRVFYVGNY